MQGKRGKALGRAGDLILSRSIRISVPFPYARISTASLSISSSVRPALRLMIFKSCDSEVSNCGPGTLRDDGTGSGEKTHSVGDAVGESDELDLVVRALPVGEKGQDQAQCGGLGVGRGIGERDVAQGGRGIHTVGGTHGGQQKGGIERGKSCIRFASVVKQEVVAVEECPERRRTWTGAWGGDAFKTAGKKSQGLGGGSDLRQLVQEPRLYSHQFSGAWRKKMVEMGDLQGRNEEVARGFIRWWYVPITRYLVAFKADEVYDLFFGAGGRMGRIQKGRRGEIGGKS